MKMQYKIIIAALLLVSAVPLAHAQDYSQRNVTAMVNITNSLPVIINLTVEQDITLNVGSTKTVTCTATIRNWGGYQNVDNVNGTFYYYLNESGDPDSGNVHYTNSSCSEVSNDGEFIANYSCSFDVWYYANNGTWYCNVSVNESSGFSDSAYNDTSINALFALNVTDVIDYGNMAVFDTSDNITATIYNLGNMDINVSVLGYGDTEGDGLGLVCQYGDDIDIEHQRFSITSVPWEDKIPLAATNQDMNITLLQPTDLTVPVTWETFWQLYVPPNPMGICTGTIRFTATTP
jgi:hypothetical protein